MKVSQPIILLQNQLAHQDLDVMVAGYEGGLDDVISTRPCYVKLNANKEDWLGSHEVIPGPGLDLDIMSGPNALVLRSTRGNTKG